FPLRGELSIKQPDGSLSNHAGPPPPGQIWVDENLRARLELQNQQSVTLGNATLKLGGIILTHPVATSDTSVLAPSLYANIKDLSAMGVLQPGSRAMYRLLLAGTQKQLAAFEMHFKNAASDLHWITPKSGRQALSKPFQTIERYLAVIILIQVLLASIAIALSAHQYSIRQQKMVALWRCLGATARTIVGCHFLSILLLTSVCIIASVSLGYIIAHLGLRYGQALGAFGVTEINFGINAAYLGTLTGLLIIIGFALPPILTLRKISPRQILQETLSFEPKMSLVSYLLALFALGGVLIFYLGEFDLALRLGAQIVIMGVLAYVIAGGIWSLLIPLGKKGSLTWRFGIAYLVRHRWQAITQWLVFTLVLLLLLLVQIIQKDFLRLWQEELPANTPNYFLVNIQSEQVQSLKQWFEDHGVKDVVFYPVVRARLSAINGIDVDDSRNRKLARGLQRPINLTWNDKVNAGHDQPLISVEEGFAQRQSLTLGDTIQFQIAEQNITGKISEFRQVNWESFKPNFFVIFGPGVLETFPHSYITSVYLPPKDQSMLTELAKQYVEISIIDIGALLQKMRDLVAKLSGALNGLFILLLMLGILILYSNLLSTLKERLHESAMMRILGANRRVIINMLLVEFGVLGALSGGVASLMALVIAHDLAHQFFSIPFSFSAKWVGVGLLMGTGVITLCGLIGANKVIRVSPLHLLRHTE
ncbi:MAG: ABC transporter permease, partial [Candidatus Berkiellales bacterium]